MGIFAFYHKCCDMMRFNDLFSQLILLVKPFSDQRIEMYLSPHTQCVRNQGANAGRRYAYPFILW